MAGLRTQSSLEYYAAITGSQTLAHESMGYRSRRSRIDAVPMPKAFTSRVKWQWSMGLQPLTTHGTTA